MDVPNDQLDLLIARQANQHRRPIRLAATLPLALDLRLYFFGELFKIHVTPSGNVLRCDFAAVVFDAARLDLFSVVAGLDVFSAWCICVEEIPEF